MRIYTAHLRDSRMPCLVHEGFSLGAFLFGPLWLFAHRAWIAGIIALAVLIGLLRVAAMMADSGVPMILLLGYAALLGWNGRDLCRWSLARRGFTERYVVAGRGKEAAFGRLVARDPSVAAADLP
jgi:hypothetical protein